MTTTHSLKPRLAAGALAALLLVAGCTDAGTAISGPSASPTASPTPSATPKRSPSPTPKPLTPTVAPSTVPARDAASGLKIGAPYKLVANPANAALAASFSIDVAGVHIVETMTGREVHRNASLTGLAYVLTFSGIQFNESLFDAAARGAARTTAGKLSFTTILGNRVAFIVTPQASFGLYVLGDTVVMVGAEKLAETKVLLTSVIKANK